VQRFNIRGIAAVLLSAAVRTARKSRRLFCSQVPIPPRNAYTATDEAIHGA
jgi:hypothetical protein